MSKVSYADGSTGLWGQFPPYSLVVEARGGTDNSPAMPESLLVAPGSAYEGMAYDRFVVVTPPKAPMTWQSTLLAAHSASRRFLNFLGVDVDALSFTPDSKSQAYLEKLLGQNRLSHFLEGMRGPSTGKLPYHPRMAYDLRTRADFERRAAEVVSAREIGSGELAYEFVTAPLILGKDKLESIIHQSVDADPQRPPRLVAVSSGSTLHPLGIEIPQSSGYPTIFVDLVVPQPESPSYLHLPALRDIYLHADSDVRPKEIPTSGGLHLNQNIAIAGSNIHEAVQYPRVFNLDNPYAKNLLETALPEIQSDHAVLDLGSGGGIVSAVVAKESGATVDAVDLLDQAVDNTLLNTELAGVSDKVRAWKSNLMQAVTGKYDAVLFVAPLAVTLVEKDRSALVGLDEDSGWGGMVGHSLFEVDDRHPALDFLPEIHKVDDNAVNVYDLDGELMLRFLRELPARLKENGAAYVMSITQLAQFAQAFGVHHLNFESLKTFEVGGRSFTIHRVMPKASVAKLDLNGVQLTHGHVSVPHHREDVAALQRAASRFQPTLPRVQHNFLRV